MALKSRSISLCRRQRRVVHSLRRARIAVWSSALMVVIVGCAQASTGLVAGDANGTLTPARTAFGHPTSHNRLGYPTTAPGKTAIPALVVSAGSTSPNGVSGPTSRPTANPTSRHKPKPTPGPTPTPPPASAPHVLVLMEENKGYAAVLSGAPYIDSLAHAYLSSSAWYGIDHPSAPNYVGFVSGSIQNVVGDCTPPGCGPYAATSLGGQLTSAGVPWTAYMESMPSPCYAGAGSGLYAEKHDPFVYFNDVLHSNCASHVLPYPGSSALVAALDGSHAPDFVWITPNLLDDMHDGSVAQGDAWARANLAPVLASSWFRNYNSTVIITMDEGNSNGSASCCGQLSGGQVPMIVISSRAAGKGSVATTGDHYGMLRSIEEVYRLRVLGDAANPVNGDLSSYFG
jgi:phosphatidylinositol-3-phosphatase